jgi:probable rRNA maturation factor
VDDAEIARVHEEFLGDPSPTDVITFPYSSVEGPIEGELVVSVETALREAERRDTNPFDEVALYVIHGILHLCGHRDDTAAGGRRMWRRQSEILAGLGLGPPRR